MTWGEIYKQFKKEYPKTEVSDYRPFVEEWLPRDRAGIIVWLKNGDVIAYFSKKTEAEGSERGIMVANAKPDKELNEAIKHICDVVQKRIVEAHQRGVEDGRNETWEAAKKIFGSNTDGGYCMEQIREILGKRSLFFTTDVIRQCTINEVIEKLKAYEEKQKEDEDVKRGDVVRNKINGLTYIVTLASEGGYVLLDSDGNFATSCITNSFEKTGKHVDIDKILEAMKE